MAGALVPAVLVLAGLTVLVWSRSEPLDQALLAGLAVLVVACPCGLGLAGALATSLGIGRLARQGCLVRGGQILEDLARVRVVAFDKTGTLTDGCTRVTAIATDGTPADEVLRRAAGLERSSEHPLARAIVAEAAARGIRPMLARRARAVPGRGMIGEAAGEPVAVGSASMAGRAGLAGPGRARRARRASSRSTGASLVHVGWAGRVRGVLALGEALRPEAPASRRSAPYG